MKKLLDKVITFKTTSVDASEYGEGETIKIRELSGYQLARIHSVNADETLSKDQKELEVTLLALEYAVLEDDGVTQAISNREEAHKLLNSMPMSLYSRLLTSILEFNSGNTEKN